MDARFKIAVFFILMLSGCSFTTSESGDVVERSKERPPEWLQNDATNSDGDAIYTVYKKSKVADLPLGVKDTQLEAVAQSEKDLKAKVTDNILSRASKSKVKLVNKAQLDDVIANEVGALHGKYASVKDIYFEKIKIPNEDSSTSEFYNVFVKVSYPMNKLDDAFQRIGSALQKTSFSDLQALGALLNKDAPSGLVGH